MWDALFSPVVAAAHYAAFSPTAASLLYRLVYGCGGHLSALLSRVVSPTAAAGHIPIASSPAFPPTAGVPDAVFSPTQFGHLGVLLESI